MPEGVGSPLSPLPSTKSQAIENNNKENKKRDTDAMAAHSAQVSSPLTPHEKDESALKPIHSAPPNSSSTANMLAAAAEKTPYTPMLTAAPAKIPQKITSIPDALAAIKKKQKALDMKKFTGAPPIGLEDPELGFVVPDNFSMVWAGVYRSSFPKEDTFEYLKCLKLKSIVTLFPEEYPEKNLKFMKEVGITHHQIGMPGNKEPFVNIPTEGVARALRVVLDKENHPILIHCNKGKHRTGCVVGCLRKVQQWGLTLIFDEYRRHAHPKSRALDQQFIELFDPAIVMEVAQANGWLPKYHQST